MKPILYGADYSVYVRIAWMALLEKGVTHERREVDVFATSGVPDWYLDLHPFGRIPAFEHDGFRLYETAEICRYVDEAFDGPPLQPTDPRGRAVLTQITGMLDAYAYRPMVWDVAVERLEKNPPDEALIAAGLVQAQTALAALARVKMDGPWMLGGQLTLADLHAAAILDYFAKVEDGREALSRHPPIEAWLARMRGRETYRQTAC